MYCHQEMIYNLSPITDRYARCNPYIAPGFIDVRSEEEKIDFVITTVTKYFNVFYQQLIQKGRKREWVFPRQLCMYFLKQHTKLTLEQIGNRFGGRDHTTAVHSIQTIKDLISVDDDVKRTVDELSIKLLQ